MVNSENIYTSIIDTEYAKFRNIYVHILICIAKISNKRGHAFERLIKGYAERKS